MNSLGLLLIALVCLMPLTVYCKSQLPVYAGTGYDMFTGNPKTNYVDAGFRNQIFQLTYNNKLSTSDDYYYVPDGFDVKSATSCSYSADSDEYTGTTEYQSDLDVLAKMSAGYNSGITKAKFTASTDYSKMESSIQSQSTIVVESTAICQAYSLTAPLFDNSVKLTTNFITSINYAYNGFISWDNVIDSFGTHIVTQTIMGGRTHLRHTMTRTSYQTMTAMGLNVAVTASFKYAAWSGDASVDYKSHQTEIDTFTRNVQSTSAIYVGGRPPASGSWVDWQSTVQNNSAPIQYKLVPITQLFTTIFFANYTQTQLSELVTLYTNAVQAYCNSLGCNAPAPDPPAPAQITYDVVYSSSYGGSGGSAFTDSLPTNAVQDVRKVLIRSGSEVDSIQFWVSDGINSFYTAAHGGTGGSPKIWEVPTGEHITQIEVRSGARIDALTFITDKGTKSPQYGGNGGSYKLVTLNGNLVSMKGRSGSRLDNIMFVGYKLKY